MCVNNNDIISLLQRKYLGLASSGAEAVVYSAIAWRPVEGTAGEGVSKVRADGAATVLFQGVVGGNAKWDMDVEDPSKIPPGTNINGTELLQYHCS